VLRVLFGPFVKILYGVNVVKRSLWIITILLILAVTLAGCTAHQGSTSSTTTSSLPVTTTSTPPPNSFSSSVSDIEATLESIYSRINPSVVNIQVVIAPNALNPGGEGLASGFVWDIQGDIVTNNHVVDGATRITVTFYDGTTVDASLVGADADSDLAVIKVNPAGIQLQPVSVADSTSIKVGQLAIAIGNPFGLQGTMTVGFVSGLGRLLPANQNAVGPTYSISDIIQTDTAINPGNSGGVLLDDTGEVIGVTQSIDTTSGTNQGVGFAIPSAILKQVVPALINSGHYDHPYLGISVGTLNPDLSSAMNLPSNQRGALVQAVTAGGPADKAGLKASQTPVTINGQQVNVGGDVIIAYNGQTVKSSDDLITFLARSGSVGQTVTLTVLRAGNQIQVQVTLGLRPSS
jgi:S1-C subfamily serine protease